MIARKSTRITSKKWLRIILSVCFVLTFSKHADSQELTASQLKQAARQSFEQGESNRAREHLTSLLSLYRQTKGQDEYKWSRRLAEVSHEYLRAGELGDALKVLAEAADLNLLPAEDQDDGLASAASGLHRRIAALNAEERFDLLHKWSMPTESRRTVRALASITPTQAPPAVFARALGERPRRDSFAIPKIGEVHGLFSTAWMLVQAADEAGNAVGQGQY